MSVKSNARNIVTKVLHTLSMSIVIHARAFSCAIIVQMKTTQS